MDANAQTAGGLLAIPAEGEVVDIDDSDVAAFTGDNLAVDQRERPVCSVDDEDAMRRQPGEDSVPIAVS